MKLLVETALSYLHQPYKWGGETPQGFDCSGLVQAILKTVNADPKGDQTADKLYTALAIDGAIKCNPCMGAIAFFGSEKGLTHVGFCISTTRMVDAAGGGSHVKTLEDAIKYNAFVKVSWIARRSNLFSTLMPNYKGLDYE